MLLKMERNLKKIIPYRPNKNWYAVQFNLNNPTTSNYAFDLFNGYTLSNFPITPNVPVTPSVSQTYNTGFGSIYHTAYCLDNNTIYAPENNSNSILVFDASDNSLLTTITGISSPFSICYNSTNNCMYYTDVSGASDTVFVLNCDTNTIVASLTVTPFGDGILSYNHIQNTIYLSSTSSNVVSVIDCSSNTVLTTINVGDISFGLCFNSQSNLVYVPCFTNNEIKVIDCSNNTIVSTILSFSSPSYATYNSYNNKVYVSNSGTNEIKVIDCSTGLISATISVGTSPYYSAYNSYENYIYVSNQISLDVSIINCDSDTLYYSVLFSTDPPLGLTYNPNQQNIIIGQSSFLYNIDTFVRVPFIDGSTNYNEFLRELQNTPKRVRHITMVVESSNQLAIPYEILTRDANGNRATNPKLPNTFTSINQSQSYVCEIDFRPKELILDNTYIFNQYIVLANSVVKMVIYYDEIDKSDMLSEIIDYAKIADVKVPDGNTRTEEEIEAKDFRPIVKPEWLKNFKVAKKITV